MREHPFQPREVGIELVRGCNFSCAMCPVTSNADKEPEKFQFLDLGLLAELAAELDRWPSVERIWFFHFGEPMAHPKYRECLETLARSWTATRADVIQHTNASLLRGAKAEAILDVPVIKKLVFSFDGWGNKESYEAMRGPHFERVLDNIRAFAEAARKRRPDLQLATCSILPKPGELPMVGGPPPRAEAVARLHELFDPLGVRVEVRELHDYSGNDQLAIAGKGPAKVFGGCPFVEKDSLYFTVNGWAQPCCAVYDEGFNVGRFGPDAGFGELMNGPDMNRVRNALRLDRRDEVSHCANCKFSLGGLLPEPDLRRWWEERDDTGLLTDPAERTHIFGAVVPTEHRGVRVELGCGYTKTPGFIGVDRYALPGVDVVADLDEPLPFDDDSVDLVYASHSLEHVRDLHRTMAEVYRVCRHGAQVCIVAPYHMQKLNLANPYHTQVFNEHTPRFWTASAETTIDPAEYAHPNSPDWGLLLSDNRDAGMDLRCVRMEFFYFPDYERLPPDEQRRARAAGVDVCDQIVYHLVAVKRPTTEGEFRAMAERIQYFEPGYVEVRRRRLEVDQLRAELVAVRDEAEAARRDRAEAERALAAAREIQRQEIEREQAEVQAVTRFHAESARRLLDQAASAQARAEELARELTGARAALDQTHAALRDMAGHADRAVGEVRRITSGTSWHVAMAMLRVRHLVCPAGSRLERLGRKLMALQRAVRHR